MRTRRRRDRMIIMPHATITLDEETARALAEFAAVLGMPVDEFLRRQFLGANGTAATNADTAAFDRWLDEISDGLPLLPRLPRQLTREDIYGEHD